MTVRLVHAEWRTELTNALRADASNLQIVCPFIKEDTLDSLLSLKPDSVQVITRFNLADCAEGVSDIAALRMLLNTGAQVRGICKLHAKLYLFGSSRAIITSTNLTKSALDYNHELGLVAEGSSTEGKSLVKACQAYFVDLWRRGESNLTLDRVDAWEEIVTRHRAPDDHSGNQETLGDFGVNADITGTPPFQISTVRTETPQPRPQQQAFIKFLGGKRVPRTSLTAEEIGRAGCHWAVSYPSKGRPRRVQDDDIIFIARSTDPNDFRIFGRAVGMKHQHDRDDATTTDIERRPWKERQSRYIRIHHAEFVAGTMGNGVSLYELIDELGADSFESTKRNAARGQGNTDPSLAYMQKPDVKLSAEGLSWLNERFQEAFDKHGRVPQDTLDRLD